MSLPRWYYPWINAMSVNTKTGRMPLHVYVQHVSAITSFTHYFAKSSHGQINTYPPPPKSLRNAMAWISAEVSLNIDKRSPMGLFNNVVVCFLTSPEGIQAIRSVVGWQQHLWLDGLQLTFNLTLSLASSSLTHVWKSSLPNSVLAAFSR